MIEKSTNVEWNNNLFEQKHFVSVRFPVYTGLTVDSLSWSGLCAVTALHSKTGKSCTPFYKCKTTSPTVWWLVSCVVSCDLMKGALIRTIDWVITWSNPIEYLLHYFTFLAELKNDKVCWLDWQIYKYIDYHQLIMDDRQIFNGLT